MALANLNPTLRRILQILLLLSALRVASAISPSTSVNTAPTSLAKREGNGNPSAAADLYGTGIRTGIYMQTIGMLMSLLSDQQPTFKFAAAQNTLAVLLSWTILARRKAFSACEAWLILSIIGTFVFPGGAALCNIQDVRREGIGIVAVWVSILWLFGSIIWLFASLVHQLPHLGTPNVAWIFTREPIDGWFRTLMLMVGCVSLVVSFFTALTSTVLIRKAARAWYKGDDEAKISWSKDEEGALKLLRYFQCMAGFAMWVLLIISSEKIIELNRLTPENDLSRPGQAIPLVIGILILMDGLSNLLKKPERLTHRSTWRNMGKDVADVSLEYGGRIAKILLWDSWRRR